MSTDGRRWEAGIVSHDLPLQAMLDEPLSFLASHPAGDFTFSTRSANDVQASPYDEHADLLDIERDLARSNISVMVPHGDRWMLLHKAPGRWFERIDVCGPDDVFGFLRQWPGDAETVERRLAGPVEVWLRRTWSAERVLKPITVRSSGNVNVFPGQHAARA